MARKLDSESEIVRILHENPRGLSSRKISSILGIKPAYKIQEVLHALQLQGHVSLKNGVRWQWRGPVVSAQTHVPGTKKELTGQRIIPRLPDRRRDIPKESRWSDFRRLCLYFAECVRLEDRAKISEYAERENTRFLTLRQSIDWRAISAGAPITLSIPPQWGQFVRHIRSRRSAPRLFLGAPVDVMLFPQRDSDELARIISPIFVLQIEFQVESDRLYLQPISSVEVNHGWLEKRFRNVDNRHVFMELCGLDQPEPDDEAGSRKVAMPGFHEVYASLFNSYREWWKEFANIEELQNTPSLQEIADRGVYNRAVLIAQPTLKYSGRLYQELLWLAQNVSDEDLDRTALRHLFPHELLSEDASNRELSNTKEIAFRLCDIAEYECLNREQRKACRFALDASVSVVTGPPGTGKSRVVAQAMANAAIYQKPVLFSSRNHQAIEAVIPRLNALVEPETLAIRLARPYGEATPESLTQTIVSMLATPRPAGILKHLDLAISDLNSILERRKKTEQTRDKVFSLYEELNETQCHYEEVIAGFTDSVLQVIERCPKLPHEKAIIPVVTRLEQYQKSPGKWVSRLVWLLNRWFRGRKLIVEANRIDHAYSKVFGQEPVALISIADNKQLIDFLKVFKRWCRTAQGIAAANEIQKLRKELEFLPDLSTCHEQFKSFRELVSQTTNRVLRLVSQSYGASLSGEVKQRFAEIRGELQSCGNSVEDHPKKLQKALRECFPLLLKEVPLWATSNLSVGRNIPRSAGVFDLLIIDEASQCDIASVIPLLFRTKRAMVVGDPMQLPHVSTLRRDIDQRLRKKFGLTDLKFGRFAYPVNSFFQLADSDEKLKAKIQLQDHHRSHPLIASYCNNTFYRKTLRIMTDVESLVCPVKSGHKKVGFQWTSIPVDVESAPGGGAISRGQIVAIISELKRLREDKFTGTVGIVSPFRAQVTRIRDSVSEEFGPELPPHWRFHVDTADGFQGDERDVILLSLPGGPEMPRGSRWFLNAGRNRFNVAVSRARTLIHVFADENWCRECDIKHIQELFRAWKNQSSWDSVRGREDLIGPVWEPKLANAMQEAKIIFQQQYPTCGRYLDFAIFCKNGTKLDVEVDGETFHRSYDGLRKIDDLYRDLTLIANGWHVLRFWVYQLREDMDSCVKKIYEFWNQEHEQGSSSRKGR